ncbi:MAG: MFS transporter [Chloroflexi bacterium]|nr:MFS transporter [Chloroflexota bacterium]
MLKKTTVAYYIAFISLGLVAAALGPTLPGLAAQTGSQINQISFLFTARSLGFLLGAFAVGHLYDRLPGHKLMTVALLLMGMLLFLTPLMPVLAMLTAVIFFLGVVESGIDVGANTLIVWLHGRTVGPYMNGLHFFFGVGALLSPLIIAQAVLRSGGIQWAYWALALLMVPAAVYLFRLPSPQTRPRTEQDSSGQAAWLLVLLIAVFFFIVCGGRNILWRLDF